MPVQRNIKAVAVDQPEYRHGLYLRADEAGDHGPDLGILPLDTHRIASGAREVEHGGEVDPAFEVVSGGGGKAGGIAPVVVHGSTPYAECSGENKSRARRASKLKRLKDCKPDVAR